MIAGDLFHRQPLLRELKEVNYLFSKLSHTKVVLIAGNHDYIKKDSYYRSFTWSQNVFPLFQEKMKGVRFPELRTAVYGFSYYSREITEPRYRDALAPRLERHEILLAHGGDEKHIPVKRAELLKLGYEYVALGHIHMPQSVIEDQAAYAGALEPTDIGDTGKHGYIIGKTTEEGVRTRFVPFASREYITLPVTVDARMTQERLRDQIREAIEENGTQNMYKIVLQGQRDPDFTFSGEAADSLGNIVEWRDETAPAYPFEVLFRRNADNLLGKYITSFHDVQPDSIEYQALCEGVHALLETKRG